MTPEQFCGKVTTHLTDIMVGQKAFPMHPIVKDDVLALRQAALDAGFNFHIASGFRSFERQTLIWNKKMRGDTPVLDRDSRPISMEALSIEEKIDAICFWSAIPGTSRHHWGGEFDVYDRDRLPNNGVLTLEPDVYLTGSQAPFFRWLKKNLSHYGFFLPYDKDRGGVSIEPWHISHRALSEITHPIFTLDQLKSQLEKPDANNILGIETILSHIDRLYHQYVINVSIPPSIIHNTENLS
ncbi:M15 family metallopeptidase [Vibrio sp.]|nr:M15 family metallopeptidase [Vibrio sp.]